MIVLSQDKTKLGEYKQFSVDKNFGGKKDQKYCIIGVASQSDVLGYYATEKQAQDEFNKIFQEWKNGTAVYEMKGEGE